MIYPAQLGFDSASARICARQFQGYFAKDTMF